MRKIFVLIIFLVFLGNSVAMASLADNGDGTVTDTKTKLIWQKATAPGTYNWENALAYCENLTLAGHTDWRLPNRNELQSLVDYSRYNPSIDPLLAADTVQYYYWSSTTYFSKWSCAWIVDFAHGGNVTYNADGKTSSSFHVRAVRAGQSGAIYNLAISKSGTGSGTVTSDPAGISCDSNCSENYSSNISVTLSSQPTHGSYFAGWSGGGCVGTGPCIVTMDTARSVIAIFNIDPLPEANAGPNQVVFDKVTLAGSALQDNIISWNWILTHQTNSDYSRTATGEKPELSNLSPGFYDVVLTVIDDNGISGTSAMTLVVVPVNVVSDIRSGWYSQQQKDQAVADANAAKDLIIAAMFTNAQLDKAVAEERIKWDVNNDGKMGLEEVLYILQKVAGVR